LHQLQDAEKKKEDSGQWIRLLDTLYETAYEPVCYDRLLAAGMSKVIGDMLAD
jgi:hypothetical protein